MKVGLCYLAWSGHYGVLALIGIAMLAIMFFGTICVPAAGSFNKAKAEYRKNTTEAQRKNRVITILTVSTIITVILVCLAVV